MSTSSRRVLFLYDKGAAGAAEITNSVRDFTEPVFALADTEHARAAVPVLRALGVEHYRLPAGSPAGLLSALAAPVEAAVTFSENLVRATAELTAALDGPGSRPTAARALTDKALQRRMLREAGVDNVACHPVHSATDLRRVLEEIGGPAVLKPARGQGSHVTHLVEDPADCESVFALASAQLAAGCDACGPLLAEEFLRGDVTPEHSGHVSVEIAVAAGKIFTLAVNGKFPLARPFRESGTFTPSWLPRGDDAAVRRLAAAAVTALGAGDGLLHVEIQLTPAGPRILECNGRLGGFVPRLLGLAYDLDTIALATRIALRQPVEPAVRQARGTTFQWKNTAPLGASRLLAVDGVPGVRREAGVKAYTPLVAPRSPLSLDTHSQPLDAIYGHAPTPDEMHAMLGRLLRKLTFTFEMADGTFCTLRADELRELNVRPFTLGGRTLA